MARLANTKAAAPPTEDGKGKLAPAACQSDSVRGDAAIQGLPGVVNDLPEVAPHEWIYIMS